MTKNRYVMMVIAFIWASIKWKYYKTDIPHYPKKKRLNWVERYKWHLQLNMMFKNTPIVYFPQEV